MLKHEPRIKDEEFHDEEQKIYPNFFYFYVLKELSPKIPLNIPLTTNLISMLFELSIKAGTTFFKKTKFFSDVRACLQRNVSPKFLVQSSPGL